MPALVLPEFPDDSGHRCLRPPVAKCHAYSFPPIKLIPAVLCRVKVSSARLLLIAPFWPSQTWFSELTPLLYRSPWEIPIRRDLLSQLQSRIWPELWKYPTRALEVVGMAHSGPRAGMDVLNVEVQETNASAKAPATRKLPSGVSLSHGVIFFQVGCH